MVQSLEQAGLMLWAPAKLNLTLEALGKRSDGFHEIRSVLQTIDLWDSIYLELRPSGIHFQCSPPNLENPRNLAWRAAESLKTDRVDKGVSIRLQKTIPEAAGLGGGSSDAAVTLMGLDLLWGTNLGQEELSCMASQLSSDAPFFMVGGTALARGRGESITPLSPLPLHWVVILKPDIPIPGPKTARLYSNLTSEHYTKGEYTDRLQDILSIGMPAGNINGLLFTVFEMVAFRVYPGLSKHKALFEAAGAPSIHLAGSGPALFTMIPDKEKALTIYDNLKKKNVEVYLARTRN
ncbi:MAG: 4-(cytidine 5'-diphospho)-2-C-methyl-D-erythritol kinase [Dehalococcoidia bacterium]|nr:4-(cytidine 5'-diphospho)-2-C-methyl-D-erythritol kinase [Dehalococcoidia bacterium]